MVLVECVCSFFFIRHLTRALCFLFCFVALDQQKSMSSFRFAIVFLLYVFSLLLNKYVMDDENIM